MAMNQPEIDRLQRAVVTSLHEHWVLFLIEGVILLVLGAAAIVVPQLATLALAIFLGWLFLVSGIVGVITTVWLRHAPGFVWSLLSAVLAIVVGVALVGWPASGALSLTLVVTAFFFVEGVASVMFALEHKRSLSGRWGWMLGSGIVDLVLGVLLLVGFPGAAVWLIGLMVGINLVFGGISLIAMALHARSAAPVR
jgi:uncharacterized membrane protein HdeD (DUF308 family)